MWGIGNSWSYHRPESSMRAQGPVQPYDLFRSCKTRKYLGCEHLKSVTHPCWTQHLKFTWKVTHSELPFWEKSGIASCLSITPEFLKQYHHQLDYWYSKKCIREQQSEHEFNLKHSGEKLLKPQKQIKRSFRRTWLITSC